MAIGRPLVAVAGAILMSACATAPVDALDVAQLRDVYVADFGSSDMATCRPSDVPLNHARARQFFERAKTVDSKTVHDHYELAPCYVEGTLVRRGQSCDWKIRAGATAELHCGTQEWYLVCDDCDDLFEDKPAR